ncbi:MAG: 4Fe-4S dicluster domain-containing protein [Chloroflexi bacterium]|nr:4Fe-4S dicluster domain-containing protein [Chloroflexota bacterium]
MQYGLYFDQTRCTGCYTCTIACKDWHEYDLGLDPASWIRVKTIEKGKFPDVFVTFLTEACYHCDKPACVEACPVNAITKREEDGIVVVDRNACIGKEACGGVCQIECPYSAPQFDKTGDFKMQKCDLCAERWDEGKKPICVEGCPMRALDAGPMDELKAKYGDSQEAYDFTYSSEVKPSAVFKPRRPTIKV